MLWGVVRGEGMSWEVGRWKIWVWRGFSSNQKFLGFWPFKRLEHHSNGRLLLGDRSNCHPRRSNGKVLAGDRSNGEGGIRTVGFFSENMLSGHLNGGEGVRNAKVILQLTVLLFFLQLGLVGFISNIPRTLLMSYTCSKSLLIINSWLCILMELTWVC